MAEGKKALLYPHMARYAAIDIGSNSVRLLVAEALRGAPPQTLASAREVTRLGESVFQSGLISREAIDRVCGVLAGMAETWRRFDVAGIRAVATAAVRDASNQQEFVDRASEALGAPVEVISGLEEARLVHLGVQSVWPHADGRVLIVDVGGGSAEMILSQHGRMAAAFSRQVGALRLTEVFLRHDPPEPAELHRLDEFVRQKIASAVERIGRGPWQRGIGTSATAAALVSAINRIPRARREEADRKRATVSQVARFLREMSSRDLAARRKVTGIGPRRAEIIVAGAAVYRRVMEDFGLASIHYSTAGVRDGIIADLAERGVGREQARLSAEQRRVVEATARRFGVSVPHARKVAGVACALFDSLEPLHRLPRECGKLLEAAAYLHDTGHYISDTAHHKHSAYIVANSEMPGFTSQERRLIALLCRYHRKSMPSARHQPFQELSDEDKRVVVRLAPLLRLADSLDRSHRQLVDSMECHIRNGDVFVRLRSSADTDLDEWAGERAAEIFEQVYGRRLALVKERPE
jgi:exopolyphosphatase/guanosine-5'-triphosphate,3'-diphosphate pyrophosphatase